jgi:hypothetical protein
MRIRLDIRSVSGGAIHLERRSQGSSPTAADHRIPVEGNSPLPLNAGTVGRTESSDDHNEDHRANHAQYLPRLTPQATCPIRRYNRTSGRVRLAGSVNRGGTCRLSLWELCPAARVGRLDLVGGKLSVVETIVRGIGGRTVFGPSKSRAGKRTMFMPTAIVTMLSAHFEQAGLTPAESDALVFTDEDGGPLRYSNWRRRVWLHAAKEAGCEGAGFHDLRRLNATTLVVGGIDVKTAKVRLGHADPRMTLAIYAFAPASVDRAADVIGERFFGQDGKKLPSKPKGENGQESPRHFRAIGSVRARRLRILRP